MADRAVHEAFVNFCSRAQREHSVAVGRYVIMPDHIHLFVCLPPEGLTLAQWVKALRSVLGKELLRLGIAKPHWQEGFFDHLLRSKESYSQKCDYVLMNPVRAGLCDAPKDWLYQGEIVGAQFR